MRIRTIAIPATMALAVGSISPALASDTVTLTLPNGKTTVAEKVTATVRVAPAAERKVRVQTRSATTSWQTVAKGRTKPSGKVKTTFTTYQSGKYQVRAVTANATSKPRTLESTYPSFVKPPKERLRPLVPGT
jgi:hypothetical protein